MPNPEASQDEHTRTKGIAVILSAVDGRPAGMGIIITPRYVVTCAHVVNASLGRRPEMSAFPVEKVEVRFPFAGTATRTAEVIGWQPMNQCPEYDVAVLELEA